MFLKHLLLLSILLIKIDFISNDTIVYGESCFLMINDSSGSGYYGDFLTPTFCSRKNGFIKVIDCRELGFFDEGDCQLCCNFTCGINGTYGTWYCSENELNCELSKKKYWIDNTDIFTSLEDEFEHFSLLSPIQKIFNFDYYGGNCYFQSKEDLLINFANQINGKFIYSLGGGHLHFDQRLMDTSLGKNSIQNYFLVYPTYGINATSDGVYYEDANVLGYDCSGLSMALIYITGHYNFNRETTNAQKMYNIAKENKYLKKEIKIGYALFYGKSENSISHVTIALGNNTMIEASGHDENKKGKPIQIVKIRNNYIGIADFIYSPFEKKDENNKSEVLRINSIIILILFLL